MVDSGLNGLKSFRISKLMLEQVAELRSRKAVSGHSEERANVEGDVERWLPQSRTPLRDGRWTDPKEFRCFSRSERMKSEKAFQVVGELLHLQVAPPPSSPVEADTRHLSWTAC